MYFCLNINFICLLMPKYSYTPYSPQKSVGKFYLVQIVSNMVVRRRQEHSEKLREQPASPVRVLYYLFLNWKNNHLDIHMTDV